MEPHEEYLLEDFKQYHEWMRHYDKSFTSMINFLYSGYAAVITAAYVLYSKYPNTKEASLGATLLFSLATLLSPVFIFWLMKKRKYFSDTARWINKIRNSYLKQQPMGIDTPASHLENENYPPYFNRSSTHVILLYFTAFFSSVMICLAVYAFTKTMNLYYLLSIDMPLWSFFVITVSVFVIHIAWIVKTLKGMDNS
ncbi:MAG: hypothetical protein HZA11_13300 [Nitrospirae bacterium]|nr:hypothetical protein [Nitrospirota bacterium]